MLLLKPVFRLEMTSVEVHKFEVTCRDICQVVTAIQWLSDKQPTSSVGFQRTHDAIITSLWRQNDVATLCYYDVIIASFAHWASLPPWQPHPDLCQYNERLRNRDSHGCLIFIIPTLLKWNLCIETVISLKWFILTSTDVTNVNATWSYLNITSLQQV